MIDSLNAGQTCLQCRHFIKEGTRTDRFFGPMRVENWCKARQRLVSDISEGEDCSAFLRRVFENRSAIK